MSKPAKYKPLLARCRAATCNANAAVLLYRICFWMPKAKIVHDGKKWVANNSTDWCAETGLTLSQYRRAIALLREKGLVETSQHLFGRKCVTHVRLTGLGEAVMAPAQPEPPGSVSADGSEFASPGMSEDAQLHMQGGSDWESLHGKFDIAFADAPAEPATVETNKKNAGEIGSVSKKPISEYEDSVLGLSELWRNVLTEELKEYVPPFTGKERGQIKCFRDACPAGLAIKLLDSCIRHWWDVVCEAKTNDGAFNAPLHPRLDFLLKFRVSAINAGLRLLNKEKASGATIKPKPAVISKYDFPTVKQMLQEIAYEMSHDPASTEEVIAIFEDLK